MTVNGEGPVPCHFLILGEAPGAQEELEGRPFVGASGKLLERALDAAGVSRDEVYITNAYKLRPPGNRNPTQAELDEHKHLLRAEFQKVDPRRVLLLGSYALRSVFPTSRITSARGCWVQRTRWYMPTWHPAASMYDRRKEPEFFEDVRRFFTENPDMRN